MRLKWGFLKKEDLFNINHKVIKEAFHRDTINILYPDRNIDIDCFVYDLMPSEIIINKKKYYKDKRT